MLIIIDYSLHGNTVAILFAITKNKSENYVIITTALSKLKIRIEYTNNPKIKL